MRGERGKLQFMRYYQLTAFAILFATAANGQTQLTDDIIRKLGGDPEKLRQEAAERAKAAPSPEEVAMTERARAMVSTLTDQQMGSLLSKDPLIRKLYEERFGMVGHTQVEPSWAVVIDRDIKRRAEAPAILREILEAELKSKSHHTPLRWLEVNLDVEWADGIMESALQSYRNAPEEWDYGAVALLSRLVATRGNESHLSFFDELDKRDPGSGTDRHYLLARLSRHKKWAAYFGLPENTPVSELAKHVRFARSPSGDVPVHLGSSPLPPGDPPWPFGQPMKPKDFGQNGSTATPKSADQVHASSSSSNPLEKPNASNPWRVVLILASGGLILFLLKMRK